MSETNGVEIKISQLEKSFGHLDVLKKIDLKIAPGEFIAIIGKSGCGKSTLLKHIAGLEEVSAGVITQENVQINGINEQSRIMFQDPRLLPWLSVAENVGVGFGLNKGWKEPALLALKQVGLEDRAHDWPSVLSGGQKQRVALARALAAEPKLLLLDEPLGALDALTRYEMQDLIEELWQQQKFTTLLVTHDVSEAITLADRVILIEQGAIKLNLAVKLPRPRNRSNPMFAELEEELLANVIGKEKSNQTHEVERTANVV